MKIFTSRKAEEGGFFKKIFFKEVSEYGTVIVEKIDTDFIVWYGELNQVFGSPLYVNAYVSNSVHNTYFFELLNHGREEFQLAEDTGTAITVEPIVRVDAITT